MENLFINNLFLGSAGSASLNQSGEQATCSEPESKSFLNVFSDALDSGYLREGEVAVGNNVFFQDSFFNSICPLILDFMRNISFTGSITAKGSDAMNIDILQAQKQVSEEKEGGIIALGLSSVDGDCSEIVRSMLKEISAMLAKEICHSISSAADNNDAKEKEIIEDIKQEKPIVFENGNIEFRFIYSREQNEQITKPVDIETSEQLLFRGIPLSGKTITANAEPDKNNLLLSIEVAVSDHIKDNVAQEEIIQLKDSIVAPFVNVVSPNIEFKTDKLTEEKRAELESMFINASGQNYYNESRTQTVQGVRNMLFKDIIHEYAAKAKSDIETNKRPPTLVGAEVNTADGHKRGILNNNIEILMVNIAEKEKNTEHINKAAFFAGHGETADIERLAGSEKNYSGLLLAECDEQTESTIFVRETDGTEFQAKDEKMFAEENDYLTFSRQERVENAFARDEHSRTLMKESSLNSVISEKIEKILEQFSIKNQSTDMIIRLKINDKDTLLVGLKNNGEKVAVDIRSTNSGIINILQSQKEDIVRNLEEKNIYANFYVDPDGEGNFERRNTRRENQRNFREKAKQRDFIEFLETSA